MPADANELHSLLGRISRLSASQRLAIGNIVTQFERSFDFVRSPESDLISDCVLREFGDLLRIHHGLSKEPFTKDKFEFALDRVLPLCGITAEKAHRGNPGHDLTDLPRFS